MANNPLPKLYKTAPSEIYDGPQFEEYCIREGAYLPASRDRTSCSTCELGELCQAGFEEQVRRVQLGLNPDLTEGMTCSVDSEVLMRDLTPAQKAFLKRHMPGL